MSDSVTQRPTQISRFLETCGLDLEPADLDWALTHRSYAFERNIDRDNERLEFLGDAVISTAAADYLYHGSPDADEGTLSKRRARLVSRVQLGRCALALGLDELILLGRGEREGGGARRRSTLGSALEAVVGILYLRHGFEAALRFVQGHILEALDNDRSDHAAPGDFKSTLQEWSQSIFKEVPLYRCIAEEGPDHVKRFTVEVEIQGRVLARGEGARIKSAENEAARLALEQIRMRAIPGWESYADAEMLK